MKPTSGKDKEILRLFSIHRGPNGVTVRRTDDLPEGTRSSSITFPLDATIALRDGRIISAKNATDEELWARWNALRSNLPRPRLDA